MTKKPFKPAWWLRNPHLQTLWPVLLRRRVKNLPLQRERIELPDGDFVDLDWIGKYQRGPVVLVLHGFEGNIKSHYAKSILLRMHQCGWRGVFLNFRGLSGEPNRLPRGYHSGETSDVAYVVDYLRARENDLHLSAIGYSLGGNVLLKWLGETGETNPLKAAVAISVPFELHKAAARIQTGFSRFYQWYFLKCLRERLVRKFQTVTPIIDPTLLSSARTINQFDDLYTAPLHGFSGVDDYYNTASSRQYLKKIKVPTLILHAKDDPFMSQDVIPTDEELSSYIELEVSETGGHVGFVEGKFPWRAEYWLEKRIPAFLMQYCV